MEIPHFNFNRILLLAAGLWPYQRSKLVRFQTILFSSILSTFTLCQFATFLTSECTPDLIINVFSSAFVFISCTNIYDSFWVKTDNVKHLLDQLQRIHNELTDRKEIAIMERYGYKAKRFTIGITIIAAGFLLAIFLYQIGMNILLGSKNGSRLHRLPILAEYFIDQEKYFYLTLLHMNVAISIGIITTLSTGLMLRVYLQHICGMFKIVSYRLEQAMTIYTLRNINFDVQNIIYKRISYAVDIHRKAMMFSKLLISSFEGSFIFIIVLIVICTSLNLYRISQLMDWSSAEKFEEFLVHLTFVAINFTYLFVADYAGQEVTDHNNYIFTTVYNIRWYEAPLHIQRLILFFLQRGSKIFILYIGEMFAVSLEHFATLTSTSISYFATLYSMRR